MKAALGIIVIAISFFTGLDPAASAHVPTCEQIFSPTTTTRDAPTLRQQIIATGRRFKALPKNRRLTFRDPIFTRMMLDVRDVVQSEFAQSKSTGEYMVSPYRQNIVNSAERYWDQILFTAATAAEHGGRLSYEELHRFFGHANIVSWLIGPKSIEYVMAKRQNNIELLVLLVRFGGLLSSEGMSDFLKAFNIVMMNRSSAALNNFIRMVDTLIPSKRISGQDQFMVLPTGRIFSYEGVVELLANQVWIITATPDQNPGAAFDYAIHDDGHLDRLIDALNEIKSETKSSDLKALFARLQKTVRNLHNLPFEKAEARESAFRLLFYAFFEEPTLNSFIKNGSLSTPEKRRAHLFKIFGATPSGNPRRDLNIFDYPEPVGYKLPTVWQNVEGQLQLRVKDPDRYFKAGLLALVEAMN